MASLFDLSKTHLYIYIQISDKSETKYKICTHNIFQNARSSYSTSEVEIDYKLSINASMLNISFALNLVHNS